MVENDFEYKIKEYMRCIAVAKQSKRLKILHFELENLLVLLAVLLETVFFRFLKKLIRSLVLRLI